MASPSTSCTRTSCGLTGSIHNGQRIDDFLRRCFGSGSTGEFQVEYVPIATVFGHQPYRESLEAYYQMLLAEMEHLSLSPESTATASGGARNSTTDTPSGAKVKAMKPSSPTPGGTPVCNAWGTEGGCRFGRECKFGHDWSSLADKGTRCWICSGVGHQKAACPFRRGDASGGSGSGGSPGVVEKGKGQKGKGK